MNSLATIRTFAGVVLMLIGMSTHADGSLPEHLRDTGLYEPGSMTVRTENLPFSPQYPLWSDGASKRRWIYLPPGTSIDAVDPDAWEFPRGTRLWKEFSHGRAIETRYIERRADGSWQFASYIWNADGNDAVLAPAGGIEHMKSSAAPGGHYSIPARTDCLACHEGGGARVLGFSALQLSPDRDPFAPHAEPKRSDELDLTTLIARGLIRNLPQTLLDLAPRINARSATERAALGYLHANCGHCHNAVGPLASLDMVLAQSALTSNNSSAQVLRSVVNTPSEFRPQGHALMRITPGNPNSSVLALRMGSRNPIEQMPPLGTQLIDDEGMALITRWIQELPTQSLIK